MQIDENLSLSWSQRVPSNSQLRDPLGLWSHHLSIQEEFTPGITSVTQRARYYTILAFYYEKLFKNKVIDTRKFEKIFILSSLAHHDGNYSAPGLLHMYNNQKFARTWDDLESFDLNFEINGFGRVYYNRQLEVFRCAWTDELGRVQTSRINSKLSSALSTIDPEDFKKESFTKAKLKQLFNGFCVCQIHENELEKEILSKLMFGFFSETNGIWDLDDIGFNEYMKGNGEIAFIERPNLKNYSDPYYYSPYQKNLRRRNTLLIFLKIIHETHPNTREIQKFIWSAIYFKQNFETKENISFGKLEPASNSWEKHQINVFYIFVLEKLLEEIQNIVRENEGIQKKELLKSLNQEQFFSILQNQTNIDVNEQMTVSNFISSLDEINKKEKSTLESPLNEIVLFDELYDDNLENFLATSLLMMGLLYLRYRQCFGSLNQTEPSETFDTDIVNIELLFEHLHSKGNEETIIPFLSKLCKSVVNRHLLESAQRFAYGTRNWIVTEENGCLFSSREPIRVQPRDNRWQSIRTLLLDLEFIEQNTENHLNVTEKGLEWLSKIQ